MNSEIFRFKKFNIIHDSEVMKVGTDGVLLGALANFANARTILDIGTGTGLIALMMAQKYNAEIIAIDINKKAVELAKLNVQNSKWAHRIKVLNCSLQNFITDKKFDGIICNPPFYSTDVKSPQENRKIARHTDYLKPQELIAYSIKLLSENGIISVIYPVAQADKFTEIAQNHGMYINKIIKIYSNLQSDCVRKFVSVGRTKINFDEEKLFIEKGKRHDYTDEYISLTRDFYLWM